jgi:hypothetical protein
LKNIMSCFSKSEKIQTPYSDMYEKYIFLTPKLVNLLQENIYIISFIFKSN